MSRVTFSLDSSVPADQVLAAARDFSDHRPVLWPQISRRFYKVHATGDTWADVTEGSDTMGGIWARERYEWSAPGVIRGTVQESNVFTQGGIWELRVEPRDGGSHIEVVNDRTGSSFKGKVIRGILAVAGRNILAKNLQQTLEILSREEGGGGPTRLQSKRHGASAEIGR